MRTVLFKSGDYGYDNFRIPAILALPDSRILAICEGRSAMSDTGRIHIVARISRDNGKNFESKFLIARDGENTVGNPCPVYDKDTGIIWLFLTWNAGSTNEHEIIHNNGKRRVLLTRSKDLGETWSPVEDLTSTLSKDNWTWYATGPCHGLQMKSGRLIIPCDHITYPLIENDVSRTYSSHIIYSDDHGKTWHIGGELCPTTNECCAAEIKDGLLYMTVRRIPGNGLRGFSTSSDNGMTWTQVGDTEIPDPVCQGCVIAGNTLGSNGYYPLYLTNSSTHNERRNLTLRISRDGGKTWPVKQNIETGFSAYSDLALLDDKRLACFYEGGGQSQKHYAEIVFEILNV